MKTRKLLNNVYSFLPKMYQGSEVKELDKAVNLVIHTKAPEKWLLIDLETGQEYVGLSEPDQYGMWKRIKEKDF
jgi:hypothetical protein